MAVTAYERARDRGADAMRRALLDTASRLLVKEGPQALTMRRLAAAAGCSTTVLYTTFGAKNGIAEALYREGFGRFGKKLAAVPHTDDPLERLIALGRAYRENAIENPTYYAVMFGNAIPGFVPSAEALTEAAPTLQMLIDQVRLCMDADILEPGDPQAVAEVLWAATHGAVSLELAGFFGDEATARARFETLTTAAGLVFVKGEQT
ncbi:MAG: TetR/AcrR family transcriptional regulator [Actinomycetes bacterium]